MTRGFTRLLLPPALVALVLGCSTPPSPSAQIPSGSPSILPSASTAVTSSGPSPDVDAPDLPARHITLEDPAIDMTLPVGWREVTVQEWQEDIASLPDGMSLGNDAFASRLESGLVLTTAEGYTEEAVSVQLEVVMNREATSMADAMSSVREELTGVGEVEDVETGLIEAPIGLVVRARYVIKFTGDPDRARPAHLMAYTVLLGSEGTIVIHSFGVQTDFSHQDLLDTMVSTLRRNEILLPGDPKRPWRGRVADTDFTFTYPDTFVPVPLDGFRATLAEQIENGIGAFTADSKRIVDAIDGGILRAQLTSRKPLGVGRVLRILVHRHVEDLDDAIGRTRRFLGDPDILGRDEVTLPLGNAAHVRLAVPGAQAPAAEQLYAVLINDGMSLTIDGRSGQDDEEFGSILREFAESLRHR